MLASPGLLGCGQHNIFRARTFSTGIASEDVVNGRLLYFFVLSYKFQNLAAAFTSEDTKKKESNSADVPCIVLIWNSFELQRLATGG